MQDYKRLRSAVMIYATLVNTQTDTVASPGFVARRGKDWNYVMGHSRWTSGLLDD